MKSIQIKYLSETNTQGARLKAWTEAGSMTVGRDYDLEDAMQAVHLAIAYCRKHEWPQPTGFGTLPNGDYVATLGTYNVFKEVTA